MASSTSYRENLTQPNSIKNLAHTTQLNQKSCIPKPNSTFQNSTTQLLIFWKFLGSPKKKKALKKSLSPKNVKSICQKCNYLSINKSPMWLFQKK